MNRILPGWMPTRAGMGLLRRTFADFVEVHDWQRPAHSPRSSLTASRTRPRAFIRLMGGSAPPEPGVIHALRCTRSTCARPVRVRAAPWDAPGLSRGRARRAPRGRDIRSGAAIQEISDRVEIEQLLVRYCYAVDQRELVRTTDGWRIAKRAEQDY